MTEKSHSDRKVVIAASLFGLLVAAVVIAGVVASQGQGTSTTSTSSASSTSATEAKFRAGVVDPAIEGALPGFCTYMRTLSDAQAYTWMGDRIDNLGNPSPSAKSGLGSMYKQECARLGLR